MTTGYLWETPADREGRLERERESEPLKYVAGELGALGKFIRAHLTELESRQMSHQLNILERLNGMSEVLTNLALSQEQMLNKLDEVIQLLKDIKYPQWRDNATPNSFTAASDEKNTQWRLGILK